MTRELFGETASGETVERVTLKGGGLSAKVITWGAVVQDLRLEGHDAPLVLGFDRFEDYPAHSPYFGAIAGRYANRIRDGRFFIDGIKWQTDTNFLGKHLLHGGAEGIGKRVWSIAALGDDFVTLTLCDPDGAMGFPGNLDITCTYRLADAGRLVVELDAQTDAPTLCNLAHHSYFNLDDGGEGDCLDHKVMIEAEAYLPVDSELIPTGDVLVVGGSPFDFRETRAIRSLAEGRTFAYDHNFCLFADRAGLRRAAKVEGARSGVAMEVWTTEPGLQFYSGEKVARPIPGLEGRYYGAYAGFAMEPQVWPDAPNHRHFPQAILRPGEKYRQISEYRFELNVAAKSIL
ncbi:galactose mutarotase [Rhizobiales bacterium]|uniref:aldose epimerase family protein n=1 Tax=Hongsoonwoonella zoysiae TaxID=2821844 RepID=UPI0015606A2E|nr:aldose epimerase family protein [Hongsoonwoonella zoysiae]NRG18276.1 galactose mutarotase [Hongsoonwoonella zoysiae]